jgi:hypothetical protein
MLRIFASAFLHYTYKLQREWKREWNRLTELLHDQYIIFIHCVQNYSHTHTFFVAAAKFIYSTIIYFLIQRSTIGQSVFASFLMVAGYYVITALYVLLYSGRNYPTRLETRTKEFNWIASRRVSHKARRQSESNIVRSTDLPHYCSTGWLRICIELYAVCILLSHD